MKNDRIYGINIVKADVGLERKDNLTLWHLRKERRVKREGLGEVYIEKGQPGVTLTL